MGPVPFNLHFNLSPAYFAPKSLFINPVPFIEGQNLRRNYKNHKKKFLKFTIRKLKIARMMKITNRDDKIERYDENYQKERYRDFM